jgi:hypothetical protein
VNSRVFTLQEKAKIDSANVSTKVVHDIMILVIYIPIDD